MKHIFPSCLIPILFLYMCSASAQTIAVETFAGGEKNQISALEASFANITGITSDDEGNIYIAEFENHRIMKYSSDGKVSVFAGTGTPTGGHREDGHPAKETLLQGPTDVVIDPNGNLVFSDRSRELIRRINQDGTITTIAGRFDGTINHTTNVAAEVSVTSPAGLGVDEEGNIYVAETGSHIVRKISSDGSTLIVAGTPFIPGFSGDGAVGIFAQFDTPVDVEVTASGEILIADFLNSRLRKIGADGIITTIAGNGSFTISGDGGLATEAGFSDLKNVSLDLDGNVYVSDDNRIRLIDNDGQISTYAGGAYGLSMNGAPLQSEFEYLNDITFLSDGSPVLAESKKLVKVNPNQTIQIIAGNGSEFYSGDGVPAVNAQLNNPIAVHGDYMGNLFIADDGNKRIRRVTPDGVISTIAGNGVWQYNGDGGNAVDASITTVTAFASDLEGNLYFIDRNALRIRKIDTEGKIHTVAGNGEFGYSGDGGPATSAQINPFSIAIGPEGNLYISCGQYIRRIDGNGIISTYAGSDQFGNDGDGGPASEALFGSITSMAFDPEGNLFLMDGNWRVIRMIGTDGIVQTIAGGGNGLGENIPALGAAIAQPGGLAVDSEGNLYFSETDKHRIRKVDAQGQMTTLAGPQFTSQSGFQNSDSPADALFANPRGIAIASDGNVYIADQNNHRVRIIGGKTVVGLAEVLPVSRNMRSYPNPFTYSFQVQADFSGVGELKIITLEGKTIHTAKIQGGLNPSISPDISDGLYILILKTDTSTEAIRIIKMSE